MNCDEHDKFVRHSLMYMESSTWLTAKLEAINDEINSIAHDEFFGNDTQLNLLLKQADHLCMKSEWEDKQITMFRKKYGDIDDEPF